MHLIKENHPLRRNALMWLAAAAVLFIAAKVSSGQTPPPPPTDDAAKKPPTAQTHPNNPELWNTDAMMEEAVTQIARRYNLNSAQENYTRLLLTKRTKAFLETYETDVRELLKESIDWRIGAKPASVESYMKWAARAAPIYQAASKAILDGNEEWDAILNEDQKKIHNADIALMKTNFMGISKTMDEWQSGKTPAGVKPGGDAPPAIAQGTKPKEANKVSPNPPVITRKSPEDSWLAYVNLFIESYKLDEKQTVAAKDKIHKDANDFAVKYRERRKKEFDSLEADSKAPDVVARRTILERPLKEMFISMDRRLDQLLDSKQRAAIAPEKKKQLDENFAALAGRPRNEGQAPAEGPQLRPVASSTQPVKEEAPKSEPKPTPASPKPPTTQP